MIFFVHDMDTISISFYRMDHRSQPEERVAGERRVLLEEGNAYPHFYLKLLILFTAIYCLIMNEIVILIKKLMMSYFAC